MGKYIPSPRQAAKTIADMLSEAEEEHYLDCPDAEPLVRLAAFVLDSVFLFLLAGGFARVYRGVFVGAIFRFFVPESSAETTVLINALEVAIEAVVLFYFFVWPTSNFGGTPAKMLFGLRVIDADTGQRLTVLRAAAREIVGRLVLIPATLGYGVLLILRRTDHRALHDLLAGSAVKRVQFKKENPR